MPALFTSCEEEPQVERSKLVRTFVDITVAQSKYADYPDSLKKAKQKIFDKYGITEKEYERSIKNAEIRAEYWDKFFIEANQYLDSLKRVSNSQTTP